MKLMMLVGLILTISEVTLAFKIVKKYPILESAKSDVMFPDGVIDQRQSNQTVEEAIEELKMEILHLKGTVGILNATINTNSEDIVDNSVDITKLKIQQGHMADTVSYHGVQISEHSENISSNQANININNKNIQANRAEIQTNKQNIHTNQQNINTNKNNIEINKHSININQQSIDNNKKDIVETKEEVQLLESKHQDLSDSFKRSNLKFHAETKHQNVIWPYNTVVTYVSELVDTHNAFNPATGTFTAPFDGTFGFFFFAHFASENGYLYAYHNDKKVNVSFRYSMSSSDQSSTVYFVLDLKENDRVKIDSGNSDISMGFFPAKFAGFLLQ